MNQFGTNKLVLYHGLKDDPVIKSLQELINFTEVSGLDLKPGKVYSLFQDFLSGLIEAGYKNNYTGNLLHQHILYLVLEDENAFSLACEEKDSSYLEDIARGDLAILRKLMLFDYATIYDLASFKGEIIWNRDGWNGFDELGLSNPDSKDFIDQWLMVLRIYYENFGCGIFGKYAAFHYDGDFNPIYLHDDYDTSLYKEERNEYIERLKGFLDGTYRQHTMITGDPGVGKTAFVFQLVSALKRDGLRLIRVDEHISKEDVRGLENYIRERNRYILLLVDIKQSFPMWLESLIESNNERLIVFVATASKHTIYNKEFIENVERRFIDIVELEALTDQEYIELSMSWVEEDLGGLTEKQLDVLGEEATKLRDSREIFTLRTARQFSEQMSWRLRKIKD